MKSECENQNGGAVASKDLLDRQFETNIIKSFQKETGGYSLTFDNGWSFWMPDVGFAPEAGQTAKLYGRGTGYTVRGLVVNDRVVFYRTEAEQEELHRKEQAERESKKRTDYDAKADDYNRRVSALPPPFAERIMGFRNWKPETWRYDFEPYELFTCEQAVEIATALKTPDEISRFHKLDFPEQKKLVAALSDDHSGNTFGAACLLANIYLTKPELLPKAHGALCPLVGCNDYGCVAGRSNESSSATARIIMDSNCNKSAEVNGGTPFAEARGSVKSAAQKPSALGNVPKVENRAGCSEVPGQHRASA